MGALQPHKYTVCVFPIDETQVPQQSYRRFSLCHMGDICLNITITHTTADSQGGQEKPATQETWVGPRQTAASPQSFYITSSQLEGW